MPKRRVKRSNGRYGNEPLKEKIMGDGTSYVVEQLGLALKAQQEAYNKLMEQATAIQKENEELKTKASPPSDGVEKAVVLDEGAHVSD